MAGLCVHDKAIEADQLSVVTRNFSMDVLTTAAWAPGLTVMFTSTLPLVGHPNETFLWSWTAAMWLWCLAAGFAWIKWGRPKENGVAAGCLGLPVLCVFYFVNACFWFSLIAYLFHSSELPEFLRPELHDDLADMTLVTSRLIAMLMMVGIAISYTIQQSPHRAVFFSCLGPLVGGTAFLFFREPASLSALTGALVIGVGGWLTVLAMKLNSDLTQRMVTDRDHKTALCELEVARDQAETLRTAAEAASDAKSNFMATMSHELRTPLNAIIGFSELMSSGYFPDDRQRQIQYATDIHNSGKHLLALVEDVLDIQKIEGGKRSYEFRTVSAAETVEQVTPMLSEQAAQGGVDLRIEVPEELYLHADEQALKQIIINLVANAIRHTPSGGSVAIRLQDHEGMVRLDVTDTGEGIRPDIADRIFDAFVTGVESATQAGHGGTGLGLTIASELVAAHKGRIWFDTTLGKGTRFHVTFPKPTASPSTPYIDLELHRIAP